MLEDSFKTSSVIFMDLTEEIQISKTIWMLNEQFELLILLLITLSCFFFPVSSKVPDFFLFVCFVLF